MIQQQLDHCKVIRLCSKHKCGVTRARFHCVDVSPTFDQILKFDVITLPYSIKKSYDSGAGRLCNSMYWMQAEQQDQQEGPF